MTTDKPSTYSIDTSSLLEAWERSYPPDHFPALWGKLQELIQEHRLYASEEVCVELEKKQGDVYRWARKQQGFLIETDPDIATEVNRILGLPVAIQFVDTSKGRHAADPFVIAVASLHGHVVVTEETNSLKHPKIPDVCNYLGIEHLDVLSLIRRERWVF